jgi:hypothetical protein
MTKREELAMDDVFAEIEADAISAEVIPTDEKLKGIAGLVQKQLQLEEYLDKLNDHVKNTKKDLEHVQTRELPDAMMEIGLSEVAMASGEKVSIKAFVSASISEGRKQEAHTWLRDNNHGDLIKTITSVNTGRDIELAEKAMKALQLAGFEPDCKENVHAGTLKAFIREQVEAGVSLPLELFGAFLGQKSTIKRG